MSSFSVSFNFVVPKLFEFVLISKPVKLEVFDYIAKLRTLPVETQVILGQT